MAEQALEPPEKRKKLSEETFNYEQLILAERFKNTGAVLKMDAEDFTMEYVRQSKLKQPILFTGQLKELGMKIPSFNVRQILQKMPKNFSVKVIDNSTREEENMPVEEFEGLSKDRSKSLQTQADIFDHQAIAGYIQAPTTIRKISWKNIIFPRQTLSFRELLLKENYIKIIIKKFCKSFGYRDTGESICVHVKSGERYYFLIEPTLQTFEKLQSYNSDSNEFFGDQVSKCTCVCVEAGQTLIIPAGWIYSIYTPTDSIDSGDEYMFIYQPLLWYFIADVVLKSCGRDYVRLISSLEYLDLVKQKSDPNNRYSIPLKKPLFYDNPKANKMPEVFNDDYLRSWDRTLYTDLALLHSMFVNIMKDPEDARVAEGIWRPNHLLTDFRRILQRYNDLQRSEIPFTPFTIKQETISIEKESNSNTEVIQLDDENESEVDNSNSLNNEVGNSDILNDEVEQPTSTVSSESNEVPSTSTNSTTIQKRQSWKQKIFKVILMCQSDVLEKQLADESVKQIEFDGISADATKVFIDWIYTGQTTKFNEDVEALYKLASKYNIADLKTECTKLLKSPPNKEKFCQHLILAFEHGDQEFQQHMINVTKQIDSWRDTLLISDQWLHFAGQNRALALTILNRLMSKD